MKKIGLSFLTSALLLLAWSMAPITAYSATFFKCPPGFEWQLKSDQKGVRCKRTSSAKVQNIRCPNINIPGTSKKIGTFPSTKPGRDKCKGSFKVAGVRQTTEHNPLSCPSGYRYRKNYSGNQDKCVKPGTTSIVPPTLRFQ